MKRNADRLNRRRNEHGAQNPANLAACRLCTYSQMQICTNTYIHANVNIHAWIWGWRTFVCTHVFKHRPRVTRYEGGHVFVSGLWMAHGHANLVTTLGQPPSPPPLIKLLQNVSPHLTVHCIPLWGEKYQDSGQWMAIM